MPFDFRQFAEKMLGRRDRLLGAMQQPTPQPRQTSWDLACRFIGRVNNANDGRNAGIFRYDFREDWTDVYVDMPLLAGGSRYVFRIQGNDPDQTVEISRVGCQSSTERMAHISEVLARVVDRDFTFPSVVPYGSANTPSDTEGDRTPDTTPPYGPGPAQELIRRYNCRSFIVAPANTEGDRPQIPPPQPENPHQVWCDTHGYTDAFFQDGHWWAFPPNGVMPQQITEVRIALERQQRIEEKRQAISQE